MRDALQRLRDASALWGSLRSRQGQDARDAVWAHPDLLPGPDDFDDPDGFVRGRPELDISGLDLEGLTGEAAAGDGPADGKPGDGKPGDGEPGDGEPGEADGKPGAGGG